MDVFIIKLSSNNYDINLLKQFQKKEISNQQKLIEHCLSYYMLEKILKDFYKIEEREIIFENKKPFLKNRQKYFSISHSNEYAVIAFSDDNCGVDIEKIKPRNYKAISKRMGFKCNNLEEFYFEWTKFESEYKLGDSAKTLKQWKFKDYIISAVSIKIQENIEIYIQNSNTFSNLIV